MSSAFDFFMPYVSNIVSSEKVKYEPIESPVESKSTQKKKISRKRRINKKLQEERWHNTKQYQILQYGFKLVQEYNDLFNSLDIYNEDIINVDHLIDEISIQNYYINYVEVYKLFDTRLKRLIDEINSIKNTLRTYIIQTKNISFKHVAEITELLHIKTNTHQLEFGNIDNNTQLMLSYILEK